MRALPSVVPHVAPTVSFAFEPVKLPSIKVGERGTAVARGSRGLLCSLDCGLRSRRYLSIDLLIATHFWILEYVHMSVFLRCNGST